MRNANAREGERTIKLAEQKAKLAGRRRTPAEPPPGCNSAAVSGITTEVSRQQVGDGLASPLRLRLTMMRHSMPLVAAAGVSACGGPQSTLVTAGRDAAQIAHLFTVMAIGALIVWVAVVGIAVYAIRVHKEHSERAAKFLIVGGGVALPTVVLAALLLYGLPVLPAIL